MGGGQRAGGRDPRLPRRGWNGSAAARACHSSSTTPSATRSLHHPGDQASFDIFRQAGRALGPRRPTIVDPLAGLDVQRLVAAGGSQSAMRLVAYLNAFHRDAPVFDGVPALGVGGARAPTRGGRDRDGRPHRDPHRPRHADRRGEQRVRDAPPRRAPVTDTEHLRIWEVAGTPHGVARNAPTPARRPGTDRQPAEHPAGPRGRAPRVHQLARRRHPRAVAAADRHRRRAAADASAATTLGNVVGGIRLPELEAPTHEYHGVAFGTGRAPLFGAARPFADDELRARYPDPRRPTSRDGTTQSTRSSPRVRCGPEDAPAMKARGDAVSLPMP